MKYVFAVAALALALGAPTPGAAQGGEAAPGPAGGASKVIKIEMKGAKPSTAAAPAGAESGAASPGSTAKAPFGCDARKPAVCHFRIFYARGGRDVTLPAGMKVDIPDIRIGNDTYCISVNQKPVHQCARKTINAKYNG